MTYCVNVPDLPKKPHTKFLFLVEGRAEEALIDTHLKRLSVAQEEAAIICFEGTKRIADVARTLKKIIDVNFQQNNEIRSLGFLGDSELDPSSRIDAYFKAAKDLGFDQVGRILRDVGRQEFEGKKVAISLSPGNNTNGRIEDLVLQEIHRTEMFNCISSIVECLQSAGHYKLDNKALVQMFISASHNTSLAGIGRAFSAGVFNSSHAAYACHTEMIDYLVQ